MSNQPFLKKNDLKFSLLRSAADGLKTDGGSPIVLSQLLKDNVQSSMRSNCLLEYIFVKRADLFGSEYRQAEKRESRLGLAVLYK